MPEVHALTESEQHAITDYETATAGIQDCFDGIDAASVNPDDEADHLYLNALPGLLSEWWGQLDTLDGTCGSDGVYAPRSSIAAHLYLNTQMNQWFTARQDVLCAIAQTAGHKVPQPDHHATGEIETSDHSRGVYGYYDPELRYRIDCTRTTEASAA